jgi:hypothetical protein
VVPLIAGNIPQRQNPVNPRNKSFFHSLNTCSRFLLILYKTKGKSTKNAKTHLQKAKEIGGTKPEAPLEIAK